MSVYASLTAKYSLKMKLGKTVVLPKRLSLSELNEKLVELEQLSAATNQSIPIRLKLYEESVAGTTVLFSNEWTMKSGNPTNILVLVNYALSTYYPDTEEQQKQQLIEKIEQALAQSTTLPSFDVSKQKQKKKETEAPPNILDHVRTKEEASPQETQKGPLSYASVRTTFTVKQVAPWILTTLGMVILSVVLAVGTSVSMTSELMKNVKPVARSTSLPATSGSVQVPFLVQEEGKDESLPITLTSYMQVDQLTAVKGTTTPNKTIIVKTSDGKERGKTTSNEKGAFEIQFTRGDPS